MVICAERRPARCDYICAMPARAKLPLLRPRPRLRLTQRAAPRTPHEPRSSSQLARTHARTHAVHGGERLGAGPWRQLLLRLAQPGAAVLRPPGRRRRPVLLRGLRALLHRHGGPRGALLHAVDHGDGGRLRLRPPGARRRRRVPRAAGQRQPDLPRRPPPPLRARQLLRRRCATRRPRLGGPSRRGRRAAVVAPVVAAVPLGAEHAAVAERVLQRDGQAPRAAPDDEAARRVVAVEGAAEVRSVPDAAVPEGQGAGAAEARAQQGGAGGGEPVARVHVERRRVVPRQCRHGRPRRHPLLQEVQRKRCAAMKEIDQPQINQLMSFLIRESFT